MMNMRKWYRALALCLPYAYLSMLGDALWGTVTVYIVSGIWAVLVAGRSARKKQWFPILIGDIIGFLLSLILSRCTSVERWNDYFKPFSPGGMVCVVALGLALLQWSGCRAFTRK